MFHAGPPAAFGSFVVVALVLFHAAARRVFFVPFVAECAHGSSCHGVGNGNAADAGSVAVLPVDSDLPNTAVDNQAVGRVAAPSGDPSDPSRGAAVPIHAPSDDPSVVAHTLAIHKSTPAASDSSAPEYAG